MCRPRRASPGSELHAQHDLLHVHAVVRSLDAAVREVRVAPAKRDVVTELEAHTHPFRELEARRQATGTERGLAEVGTADAGLEVRAEGFGPARDAEAEARSAVADAIMLGPVAGITEAAALHHRLDAHRPLLGRTAPDFAEAHADTAVPDRRRLAVQQFDCRFGRMRGRRGPHTGSRTGC